MKTIPYPFQLKVYEDTRDLEAWALFLSPGLGKSKIAIDTLCHLHRTVRIDAALIVCPNGIKSNWDNELSKHMWRNSLYSCLVWKPTAPGQRKTVQFLKSPFPILVMNVESFSSRKGIDFAEQFLQDKKCMLVIDESTYIANPQAIRTKALIKLAELAPVRRIMTGTPVTESPLNLPSQVEVLGPLPKYLGVRNWFQFRNIYANTVAIQAGPRTFKKVVGYKHLDRLSKMIRKFATVISKEEVLTDLPEKTYNTYNVELTPEQKKHYLAMKRHAVTLIGENKASAPIVLTQLLRLQQIVCGFIRDDEHEIQLLANNRVTALLDLISTLEGKIIIWATFKKSIWDIEKALNKEYGDRATVTYYGATVNRAEVIERFQNGDARFFVSNPSVGGFGLTLTSCATMVYYSNGFSYAKRLQSEDRIHRIGQRSNVLYIDLIAENTIDEKIQKALKSKKSLVDLLMGEGETL